MQALGMGSQGPREKDFMEALKMGWEAKRKRVHAGTGRGGQGKGHACKHMHWDLGLRLRTGS